MRVYILLLLDTTFAWQAFLSPEQLKKTGILPWIGVLKVRSGNTEFATCLTLITERLAAANANDISKLDKETLRISTKAIFFKHNIPWYCDVMDYQIHPEFNNSTLVNTLAILTLDCNRRIWTPINWPMDERAWQNIYAVGLSDRNYDFEQIIFRMKYVNSKKCSGFYIKEEIDYKHLWPKHFSCYRAVFIRRQCVFDSGMALVSMNNGTWTLIGIGVLGPGCVLPSRYIDILPYIPWMNEQTKKHRLNNRRQLGGSDDKEDVDDDKNNINVTAIDPSEDIVSDVNFVEDDFYVEKLNDRTMVLRPKNANIKEKVHGDCSNDEAVLIYRDAGIVRTSKRPATGTYALSLYDLFYYEVTCVMVTVGCDRRSITKFWFDVGFKTDDLADLIKVVPQNKRGQTIPPKILYLTDTFFNYEHINTSNLVFKFEFTGQATINVDFYGTLVTTAPPPTTSTTPRTRGTHRTFVVSTLGALPIDRLRASNRYNRKNNIYTKKDLKRKLPSYERFY